MAKKKQEENPANSEDFDYVRIPPDGGYAWVILAASFFINLIIDGFLYAFGAISDDLKQHFQCPEWAVSLVISLACSCYLVSAPLASALCNRFGCQIVGFIGGIVASFSVALSIFSPNIQTMWILFGFIGGIGMGLVYLPSLIMIGYYFEKKRAVATGIVTAGTGIGSIIFGPLSRNLFDFLGWRIGLVALSVILSGSAFCCLTMKPVKPVRKAREQELKDLLDKPAVEQTASNIPEYVNVPSKAPSELQIPSETRARSASMASTRSRRSVKAEDAERPMYQSDILYPGNVQDLPEFKAQPNLETYIQETTIVPETDGPTSSMKSFWDAFLKMTNIALLQDKRMIIMCLANVCSMIGFYSPYLFIVNTATNEHRIPRQSAVYLLSFIGFSNTVVRFVSGWITKIPFITPLVTNIIGLTIAGIVTLFVPFCDTLILLTIYCIIWGASIAFHISMTPVAICQLVGLEKFSSALSIIFLFRGISCLVAPPLMGAIKDYTTSFNVPFVISGISFIASGALHLVTLMVDQKQAKSNKQAEV